MGDGRTLDPKGTIAERLGALGVRGVLVQMARNGQILDLKCEMPTCYREREDPNGRTLFDPWPEQRSAPEHRWSPNADHYPTLKMDGGQLKPWNVRLAHVLCNNLDYGWRKRIRLMLEDNPKLSFESIAEVLNRRKRVLRPPQAESWTAEIVRGAYVS